MSEANLSHSISTDQGDANHDIMISVVNKCSVVIHYDSAVGFQLDEILASINVLKCTLYANYYVKFISVYNLKWIKVGIAYLEYCYFMLKCHNQKQ
jgi:hypothetical protein